MRKGFPGGSQRHQTLLELFFSQTQEGAFFMMPEEPFFWDRIVANEELLDYLFQTIRITKVNEALLRRLRVAKEQLVGRSVADLYAHKLAFNTQQLGILLNEKYLRTTTLISHANGVDIWVEGDYSCLCDDQGRIVAVFGMQRNITTQIEAHEALEKSQQDYLLLFKNNPLPMWIYDTATLRFLAINDAAISSYGYSEEEFLQMSLVDIRPKEDIKLLDEYIGNTSRPNPDITSNRGVWRHKKKDGTIIYVDINLHAQDFQGRKAHWVLSKDVTEQIRSEALIQTQKDLLEKIARNISSQDILKELCLRIEELNPGAMCAILKVVAQENCLRVLAAPHLPKIFKSAIEGLAIGPKSSPHGMAAYLGKRVIVEDVTSDPTWKDRRDLLSRLSLKAYWSFPILSVSNEVIATFAIHYQLPRVPNALELSAVEIACNLVSIVMERDNNHERLTQSIRNELITRQTSEQERQKHLETLTKSERRFRKLAENSPDVIFIVDVLTLSVMYINRKEFLGYIIDDVSARADFYFSLIHEDDLPKVSWYQKQGWKPSSPDTNEIEYRLKNRNGEWEWVNSRMVIMDRDENDFPLHILVNLTVITDRRKVQEALEESRANLAALVENTTDGIHAINRNYQLTAINSSFKETFASVYRAELGLGDNILTKAPKEVADHWLALYNRTFAGERLTQDFIYNIRGKDIYVEVSFNPIYNHKGTIDGASIFARNVTRKRIAENELVKANFELDSFVYRASHDLRAPLRSVLGLVNLIRIEPDFDKRDEYLKLIEKSIGKQDTFITDLTDFSRNSRMELQIQSINFDEIIKETCENLRYMDHAAKLALIKEVTYEAPFYSDPTRISIIFQNLLSNAVKYQRLFIEDSWVKVSIHCSSKQVMIVIKDNGRGIAAEYLDKVFNMFFRASIDSYGSGLGLYITKQVVERLKGTVQIESELGSSTQFTIILPNSISSDVK